MNQTKRLEGFAADQEQRFHQPPTHAKPDNPTGIHPTEFRVLIRLDPTIEKTAGGVFIPDERQDRNQMAETEATLIEVGGRAFEDFGEPVPRPGDRVLVRKYAGETRKAGDITDLYRICNDKEVVAVLDSK